MASTDKMMAILEMMAQQGASGGQQDNVPAQINSGDGSPATPAALSEGEFVIPADVVSLLGQGNTDAGAQLLNDLISKVRKQVGAPMAKGEQINPLGLRGAAQ
jgi:hypothetical protein